MTTPETHTPAQSTTDRRYPWELLVLLWLAFFLNQADRQIYGVVLPLIKRDLKLTDEQLGLIASVLFWTYGLLVPVAGYLGDRFSKTRIITYCLFFWSCATLTTGFCATLLQFVVVRGIATGGGEAFYAPSANALLSQYHAKNRSLVLSIHQTGVYIGITLSGLIAGFIAERYGWRNAFYGFGAAGIVLAFVLLKRLRPDVPAVRTALVRPSFLQTALVIYRKPTVWCLTLGFACMVFVTVAFQTWMPTFLFEKFGLSLTEAGFYALVFHHIGAFVGVLLGGNLADRFARSQPRNRLVVHGLGLLLAVPFIVWVGQGTSLVGVYAALTLFGLFRGVYDSNIFAALYEVVPVARRATASGLLLMFAFLIGAIAPYLLGVLKPTLGLSLGFSSLAAVYGLGGLLILGAAYWFFKKDTRTPRRDATHR